MAYINRKYYHDEQHPEGAAVVVLIAFIMLLMAIAIGYGIVKLITYLL
jgi:hypothetical protein